MTGEQLFFQYLDNGPVDYANLLMSIYKDLGDELYPLLLKANDTNTKLDVKPVEAGVVIGDLTEADIIFV